MGEIPYSELIVEAGTCEPFRSLINPDDALFTNPANMEQAIKTYCSDYRQPIPMTHGQIVRCIFESLALRYRQVLDSLRNLHHVRWRLYMLSVAVAVTNCLTSGQPMLSVFP